MAEFGSSLNVICLESEGFYALVEEVVGNESHERKKRYASRQMDKARQLLRISYRTTFQKLRDERI